MKQRYAFLLAVLLAPSVMVQSARAAEPTELARQVQALQKLAESLDARLAKLEGGMQNQQLLGMLQDIETLKSEIAQIRGQTEVQAHELDTLGKRQNDLYVDLDQRVGELSKAVKAAAAAEQEATVAPAAAAAAEATPAGSVAPTAAAPDALAESRGYEAALNLFRQAHYAGAIAGFKAFLKAYPESALAPNAQYWVGYSYYALKDYKSALAQQQKLVAAYPTSTKVPDALLNIAASQIELKNMAAARKTLEELVAKHPGTNAATLASRRLSALK